MVISIISYVEFSDECERRVTYLFGVYSVCHCSVAAGSHSSESALALLGFSAPYWQAVPLSLSCGGLSERADLTCMMALKFPLTPCAFASSALLSKQMHISLSAGHFSIASVC